MTPSEDKWPYLVLTTGFPSSGKSEVSEHLSNNLGFYILSTDKLRQNLYGVGPNDFFEFQRSSDFNEQENAMFDLLDSEKKALIRQGKDVVIDATAPTNYTRQHLFNTVTTIGPYNRDPKNNQMLLLHAQKHLLYLNVTQEEITRRNQEKGRTNDVYARWAEMWEEPNKDEFEVLEFVNNTPEQLNEMKRSLDDMFRR